MVPVVYSKHLTDNRQAPLDAQTHVQAACKRLQAAFYASQAINTTTVKHVACHL